MPETTQNLTRLTLGGREFIVLGTAHVSRESVDQVAEVIKSEEPDRVCIEIDEARHKSLTQKQSWEQLDIFRILREKKGFLLIGNLVLSSFQRRIGVDLGVTPGEEMLAAVKCAEEASIPYSFVDRQIHTTLRRAWSKASLWGKNKMLAALLGSVFTREKLSNEEIEALKQQGALENMMHELADYLPAAKEVLIDERDRFIAAKSFAAEGDRLLLVVGAGHVPGIISRLEEIAAASAAAASAAAASTNSATDAGTIGDVADLLDVSSIDVVPPPGLARKILPWIIPAAVAGLIAWGFFRAGWDGGLQMLLRWFIVNGTLSAIGALIALAHPVTIILSFLAAPFTSMNPTIGVGFVTGFVEAMLRKPRVMDFENLHDDIVTVRGFYRNRFTRILLVFLFSSIGSSIGTFVALPFLFPGVAG